MSLLRYNLDPAAAVARPAVPADHGDLARMLASGRRRFLSVPSEEIPALLGGEPGVALVGHGALWAAAVAERTAPDAAWLRALALADGLPPDRGMDALLDAYHQQLRAAGVRHAYYSGSETGDAWTRGALAGRGYERHTEVVVYEKIRMDTPPAPAAAAVRPARPEDLAALTAVDHAAFASEWHKGERALAPALAASPCFLAAELGGALAGYAFATSHYGGRLVHLARIAVLPEHQGRGLGAQLLAAVVAHARAAAADVLTLNTQVDNAQARRLYERFGFRRTGERQTVLRYRL